MKAAVDLSGDQVSPGNESEALMNSESDKKAACQSLSR